MDDETHPPPAGAGHRPPAGPRGRAKREPGIAARASRAPLSPAGGAAPGVPPRPIPLTNMLLHPPVCVCVCICMLHSAGPRRVLRGCGAGGAPPWRVATANRAAGST